MILSEYAKERTISWLEGMQQGGAFDGFQEQNMEFRNLDDDDLKYYFVEWFFTEPDEDVEDEKELIAERKRIFAMNV